MCALWGGIHQPAGGMPTTISTASASASRRGFALMGGYTKCKAALRRLIVNQFVNSSRVRNLGATATSGWLASQHISIAIELLFTPIWIFFFLIL